MSAISLRLADSLHRTVRDAAQKEGVSINQFVSTALAEKLSALMTEEILKARARRASREKFEGALAAIPDDPPTEGDELPPD